ncbi:unnamed protein product [Symbiodinium sp. CCMP2592]|nr:unnamed protein product [Symbiodinium sp. CCMP2592]
MSSDPDPLNIHLLASQLRSLTISVSISTDQGEQRRGTPAASSSSAPEPPASTAASSGNLARNLSWAFRDTSVTCPGSVLRLSRALHSGALGSPADRIAGAYRRGREAAAIVRGESTCYRSDSIGGRKVCYVVLFCGGADEPFITFNKHVYFQYVKTGPGGSWDPEAVSHGFATQRLASKAGSMTASPEYLGTYLTAEAIAGYSKLWYTRGEICSQAFVVKAIPAEFILCLPQGGISDEELAQATADEYNGSLGPWTQVNITAVGASGRELKSTIPCLLIDLQASEAGALATEPDPARAVKTFGVVRLQSVWPARVRALEALEHFLNGEDIDDRLEGYFTEEVPEAPAAAPDGAGLDLGTSEVLHQLLQQSSSQAGVLHGIQRRLSSLDEIESRLSNLEKKPNPSARAPAAAPPAEGAPAWAPQLFAQGGQASLGTDQMQHLLSLAGRGPKRLADLGSHSAAAARPSSSAKLGATPKAAAVPSMLGDLPGEEDEADAADAGDAGDPSDPLTRLLAQQTKILMQLTKKSRDPLHGLLSGSAAEDDSKLPGVKGMAARQLMVEQFAAHPDRVVLQVRARLATARRKTIQELQPRDMYYHFAETVPLGSYKTLTYFPPGRDAAEMISLLALGLVFAEQVANEQGHTRLGWLLTGRQDPPFAQVEQRRAPRAEVPHGMLADPRWIAANLAYLRDADLISERTSRSQQLPSTPATPSPARKERADEASGSRRAPPNPDPVPERFSLAPASAFS